jgi:hypothetical protein
MPAALKPERARPPASVKVRRSGPSSRRIDSTTAVSAHSAFQSQFCAWITRRAAVASGSATTPVQLSGAGIRRSRVAPSFRISVRALRRTIASKSRPAPSAMPRISSTYAGSKASMRGRESCTRPRIVGQSHDIAASCVA